MEKLYSVIPKNLLERLTNVAILAGGSIVYVVGGANHYSDLDFFFSDQERIETFLEIIRTLPDWSKAQFSIRFGYSTYKSSVLQIDGLFKRAIQLIYCTFQTIEELLSTFDFDLNRCGYYQGKITILPEAVKAHRDRIVTISKMNIDKSRFLKAVKKGYRFPYYLCSMRSEDGITRRIIKDEKLWKPMLFDRVGTDTMDINLTEISHWYLHTTPIEKYTRKYQSDRIIENAMIDYYDRTEKKIVNNKQCMGNASFIPFDLCEEIPLPASEIAQIRTIMEEKFYPDLVSEIMKHVKANHVSYKYFVTYSEKTTLLCSSLYSRIELKLGVSYYGCISSRLMVSSKIMTRKFGKIQLEFIIDPKYKASMPNMFS